MPGADAKMQAMVRRLTWLSDIEREAQLRTLAETYGDGLSNVIRAEVQKKIGKRP